MGFAILRTQKLKHVVAVRRSMAHALRTQDTPNADPFRTPDNSASVGSVEEALQKFNERLATQTKLRSNAVLAVEYLVTASPDALNGKTREQQDAYFADAKAWIEAKHGAENVVAWGIHRDETTPHLYAVVVPLDDKGKLNCRHFLGGSKALNAMQTDFAQNVGKKNGFVRGIEGSKSRHISIQKYYSQLNAATPKITGIEVPPPEGMDRLKVEAYGARVADSVVEQLRPTWLSIQTKASAFESEKDRAAAALLVAQREMERADELNEKVNQQTAVITELSDLFSLEDMEQAWARRQERKDKAVMAAAEAAIAFERQRRVDAFAASPRGFYGSENVYQEAGQRALREAGGDASIVNWAQVDGEAAAKAIRDHGQQPNEVMAMLLNRSPLMADSANHHRLESWLERNSASLLSEYQQARAEREGRLER